MLQPGLEGSGNYSISHTVETQLSLIHFSFMSINFIAYQLSCCVLEIMCEVFVRFDFVSLYDALARLHLSNFVWTIFASVIQLRTTCLSVMALSTHLSLLL